MESVSDTIWDAVICGTGLQQSLLALALSRSDKKILHVDPNEYYGGAEAALSLQEADVWAAQHSGSGVAPFRAAVAARPTPDGSGAEGGVKLAASRAYALALAPHILHSKSALVNLLVSSRAYRQLEFLAVSSFFVVEASSSSSSQPRPSIVRIPATREDVFATTALAPRAKRQLMKFLKFVLALDGAEEVEAVSGEGSAGSTAAPWRAHAAAPLGAYLQSAFGLDDRVRDYILALTLSLDGPETTVADGLFRLHRHITSMGAFGPGFAAVYPKWGGCSEIAQVACRAGAVGGAVYMLGAGVRQVQSVPAAAGTEASTPAEGEAEAESRDQLLEVELTTDVRIKTKQLFGGPELASRPDESPEEDADVPEAERLSRLVAVVDAPLPFLFEPPVEGAPVAGGAVIAIPAGQTVLADGSAPEHPIFAVAHSSDTGECPPGQCVLYLTTIHSVKAQAVLARALDAVLRSLASHGGAAEDGDVQVARASPPRCLYSLYYEQIRSGRPVQVPGRRDATAGGATSASGASSKGRSSADAGRARQEAIYRFPPLAVDLTVGDTSLDAVRDAWAQAVGGDADAEAYMVFADREQGDADDDAEAYAYE